tara:strand:- start:171 stop:545 length:375 start_codon:yes stop_codon:yes gene_type:complete
MKNMINNIQEILEKIDTDTLGEILLNKSEEIKHSDSNLIVLKIELEDLLNENFHNTEHVVSINYGDWNSLKNFISESEVENIKNIFEESLEEINESDDSIGDYSQIYISALYCNEEFVWEGTTF